MSFLPLRDGTKGSRQPFQNFDPPPAKLPTVGLGADVMVYVCDDEEELRRLGPRREQDVKKPMYVKPTGDDDIGNSGTERPQVEKAS
jgi:hypothetical protein